MYRDDNGNNVSFLRRVHSECAQLRMANPNDDSTIFRTNGLDQIGTMREVVVVIVLVLLVLLPYRWGMDANTIKGGAAGGK
jgi:hypothetical protein